MLGRLKIANIYPEVTSSARLDSKESYHAGPEQ